MKNTRFLRIIFFIAVILVLRVIFPGRDNNVQAEELYKPVAVVELFTSEGCSSCPPADRILSELTRIAMTQNPQIFTLAFHVDYWNSLGWKDPYSQSAFTQRQRVYAKTLKNYQVYTPQVIVNGLVAFEGYRKNLIEESINRMLQQPARAEIKISLKKEGPANLLNLLYTVNGGSQNDLFNIALVERGLKTDVKRGENQGRVLYHDNVVRTFKTLSLKNPSGEISISVPSSLNPNNASLIMYVQNPHTAQIIAATRLDL